MKNQILAVEILELVVREESNGAAFYEALAESSRNNNVKELGAQLAEEEKAHEITFARMQDELEITSETSFDEDGEFNTYIETLAGTRIFANEDAAVTTAARLNDREAVKFALKIERATINLYNELLQVADKQASEIVKKALDEENKHITMLEDTIQKLL